MASALKNTYRMTPKWQLWIRMRGAILTDTCHPPYISSVCHCCLWLPTQMHLCVCVLVKHEWRNKVCTLISWLSTPLTSVLFFSPLFFSCTFPLTYLNKDNAVFPHLSSQNKRDVAEHEIKPQEFLSRRISGHSNKTSYCSCYFNLYIK